VECGATQWKGTMWLRRKFRGRDETLPILYPVSQLKLWGCLTISLSSLLMSEEQVWTFARASILTNPMPCLVSMECLATADQ
jgi:hypothetical protein